MHLTCISHPETVAFDPLRFKFGNVNFRVDLDAERLLAAERAGEKIAVEVKSFLNPSAITDFYARGQFLSYRLALESVEPGDESFSRSPNILAKLAASAMAEYRAGKTQELDPETL